MKISHILISITSAFLLYSCSSKMEQLNSYNVDETFADLSVTNLDSKYFSSHRLQSNITAPIADNYTRTDDPYIEFTRGVKVVFYDDSLKSKSELVADYALYRTKTGFWEARKNVVVTNEDGTKLETDQLFGDQSRNKIFSVKKVVVTDHTGTVIIGKQGFESDMTFKNYKFLDVNGVVNMQNQYGDNFTMTQN